jgi:hypothetical protein
MTTSPTTDEQKARATARELMRTILAWECFKDPALAELPLGCAAYEGPDADFIDVELGRPYEDDGGA